MADDKQNNVIFQICFSVLYIVIVKTFLSVEAMYWGNVTSAYEPVLRMLLAAGTALIIVFSIHYLIFRTGIYRLGLIIGLIAYFYYYIYNPYGHSYVLLYLSILRSPPHLLSMFTLVGCPPIIGFLVQKFSKRE